MKAKMLNWVSGSALTVTGLMPAIIPSPVQAIDTKNYPGYMCVRGVGSGGHVGQWAGGISNDHDSSPLDIFCPVIKDVVSQGIQGGRVRVWDAHFSQPITCRLFSYRFEDGGHVAAFTNAVSSVGGNNQQDLQILEFPGLNTVAINANSHYFYECRIPPTYNGHPSFISSYSVRENGLNE